MFSHKKETDRALEALRAELATLRTELADAEQTAKADREVALTIADRLGALEARVSGMGTELSRQLHELGTELEELARRSDDSSVIELVDNLRATQIRLANEQARYEITFRQDLAELADRLLNLPRR